jgi:hypothetical protein
VSFGINLDTDQYDNSSEPEFATMMDQDDELILDVSDLIIDPQVGGHYLNIQQDCLRQI